MRCIKLQKYVLKSLKSEIGLTSTFTADVFAEEIILLNNCKTGVFREHNSTF